MLNYEKGCCLAAPALSALRRAGGVRLPLNSALPGSWVCSTPSFCAFNPTMHLTTHTGVLQPMGTSEPRLLCSCRRITEAGRVLQLARAAAQRCRVEGSPAGRPFAARLRAWRATLIIGKT